MKVNHIIFSIALCLLIAATAQAKAYVLSDGKGHCMEVRFMEDSNGGYIGTSTLNYDCDAPAGSYEINLVIPDVENGDPTPLNPRTNKALPKKDALYKLSLQVIEVLRGSDKNSSQSKTFTMSNEQAFVYQEALKRATVITVSIPRKYLSKSMTEKIMAPFVVNMDNRKNPEKN